MAREGTRHVAFAARLHPSERLGEVKSVTMADDSRETMIQLATLNEYYATQQQQLFDDTTINH